MSRRPQVTAHTTLITETVVATTRQAQRLAQNPHTRHIRDIERVGPNRIIMTVDRVDPRALTGAPARRRMKLRLPVTVSVDPGAARALRRTAKAAGLGALAITVLAGTGWVVWELWGDQITAAVKILLAAAAVLALVVAVGSVVTIARKGGCAGLHCPDCPHH